MKIISIANPYIENTNNPKKLEDLENIRKKARDRHEKLRKRAEKLGKSFPLLPYECSWAFEVKFFRS